MSTVKLGIDCAIPIVYPEVTKSIVSTGYSFIGRYINPSNMSVYKTDIEELTMLFNAGLSVVPIFEPSVERSLGGTPAGIVDGSSALIEAIKLHIDVSTAIYFFIEPSIKLPDYHIVFDYLSAVKRSLGAYKLGVCGKYSLIEYLHAQDICDYFWQIRTLEDEEISPHANICQYNTNVNIAGVMGNVNHANGDIGSWINENRMIKTWKDIIHQLIHNPNEWCNSIEFATIVANTNDELSIIKSIGDLIEKVYRIPYSVDVPWLTIVEQVSENPHIWKKAIDILTNMSNETAFKKLELFKYFPEIISKIYKY